MDFRGFDSSIILILRGGIPRPIGDFPEGLSQAMLVGVTLVGRLGVTHPCLRPVFWPRQSLYFLAMTRHNPFAIVMFALVLMLMSMLMIMLMIMLVVMPIPCRAVLQNHAVCTVLCGSYGIYDTYVCVCMCVCMQSSKQTGVLGI